MEDSASVPPRAPSPPHTVHQAPGAEAGAVDSPSPSKSRHQCYLCSRTYERADHLTRHLKSHDNERTYRCPECGKGFNRADLLNRHHAAHSVKAGEASRKRTGRACAICIRAKTRCDETRPCKRCRAKGVECWESEARIQSASQPIERRAQSYDEFESSAMGSSIRSQHANDDSMDGSLNHGLNMAPSSVSRHFEDASLLLGLNSNGDIPGVIPFDAMHTDHQPPAFNAATMDFPDFFEQVMMPGNEVPQQGWMMPPDVSNFTSDLNFDGGDFDFSFLASGLTRPSTAQGIRPEFNGMVAEKDANTPSDVHLRAEAFKKNPWSWNHWIPERNSSSFSGQDTIDIRQVDRVSSSDQLTTPDSVRLVHCDLRHAERDRMIRVVTQVANTRVTMPSFPSLELLEDLVDIFLLQDSSAIDSYIHSATFVSGKARTELLLAMVAAGARYVSLSPVWKMGLVIQEVVRIAVGELLESDNTATRELQPLQALLLMLDIGVWSGFRRKTEIAMSFLQPPVTMLAWSNAFRKFSYRDFVPSEHEADGSLEDKWHAWTEREAKKRLILHTFLHDSQLAIIYAKNPLLSPAQMMMPLPACRELWLAPNAQAWRNAYLRLAPPGQSDTPAMMDFFGHNNLLEQYGTVVDKTLCMLIASHGLGHEIWHFRARARLLSGWQNHGRRDRHLEHARQQRDLLDDLTTFQAHCELQVTSAPEVMLTLELLMMLLHVDIEDIQTFSGKLGEEEARSVFPKVLLWSQSGESRVAVFHAGQVFRVARLFEKTRLRDFYAVALHHSALTLWVYGMITTSASRKSGRESPARAVAQAQGELPVVPLDTLDDRAARSFQLLGQGTAGIHDPDRTFVPLSSSKALMGTAALILKSNFPGSSNGLPPLIDNLANLMAEIGRLSGRD
ncbi:hypothetical protein LTR17_023845 [Elasticomyces elasticus]|nr:hypothetical protein LTR17_023845 [Elasticomyces elasticus]